MSNSNAINFLKTSSKKGFVDGLKLIFHQFYFNENYIENLLDNYSVLKGQYKNRKEALIIPHGVLYGLYFYEIRQKYYINNANSRIRNDDLNELNIYQKSLESELKAALPSKDVFNMYMISSILCYLLNPKNKRQYKYNNIIFLHIATIVELVSLKTLREYLSQKLMLEMFGINERVKRLIARRISFVGQLPTVFSYNIVAEDTEFFPVSPWMDEYFFNTILKYYSK